MASLLSIHILPFKKCFIIDLEKKREHGIPAFFFFFLSFVFCLYRAAPVAYGGSQARGQIGAIAAGLRHSHSNTGLELCL